MTDKALAAAGASAADLDAGAIDLNGAPAPAAAANTPPVVAPVVVDAAAEAAAAAAATAATEAEAAAAAAAVTDDTPLDTSKWGSMGDPVGDSMMQLLQNAGVTPEGAKALMYDAMTSGDVTKVDQAALIAAVGATKAALVTAGAENYLSRHATKVETILKDVHAASGGKENWDAVSTWAKASLTAEQVQEYRVMIDAGGPQARFAAQEMASKYNADPKNTTLSANKTEIIPTSAAPSASRSITKSVYAAELSKAYRDGASNSVIAEIQAARERGRAANI